MLVYEQSIWFKVERASKQTHRECWMRFEAAGRASEILIPVKISLPDLLRQTTICVRLLVYAHGLSTTIAKHQQPIAAAKWAKLWGEDVRLTIENRQINLTCAYSCGLSDRGRFAYVVLLIFLELARSFHVRVLGNDRKERGIAERLVSKRRLDPRVWNVTRAIVRPADFIYIRWPQNAARIALCAALLTWQCCGTIGPQGVILLKWNRSENILPEQVCYFSVK